jgi:hypothetical protein
MQRKNILLKMECQGIFLKFGFFHNRRAAPRCVAVMNIAVDQADFVAFGRRIY